MAKVVLSRDIYNCDSYYEDFTGYVDKLVEQIEAVSENEDLDLWVTCNGGQIGQGQRIWNSLMERKGKTIFHGVGVVASMAAHLMAACDEIELEANSEIMFHRAYYNSDWYEPTEEEIASMARFNVLTYTRMVEKGADEPFMRKAFLSEKEEDIKDYWLSGKQAADLGIGKAFEIVRKEGIPSKIFENRNRTKKDYFDNKRKNDSFDRMVALNCANKKSGIISKILNMTEKIQTTTHTLSNKNVVAITGKSKKPSIGDIVILLNSSKPLGKTLKLKNGIEYTLNDNGVITGEKSPSLQNADVLPEDFEALGTRVDDLETKVEDSISRIEALEKMNDNANASNTAPDDSTTSNDATSSDDTSGDATSSDDTSGDATSSDDTSGDATSGDATNSKKKILNLEKKLKNLENYLKKTGTDYQVPTIVNQKREGSNHEDPTEYRRGVSESIVAKSENE